MKKHLGRALGCLWLAGCLLIGGACAQGQTSQALALAAEGRAAHPYDMGQTAQAVYFLCLDEGETPQLYGYNSATQETFLAGEVAADSMPSATDQANPHAITCLVSGEEALYALNQSSGLLFEVTAAAGEIAYRDIVTLDASLLGNEESPGYIQSACQVGGTLYLTVYLYQSEAFSCQLLAYDLATGQGRVLPVGEATCAVPYREGKVLLLTSPAYRELDGSFYVPETPELTVYDPAAGAFQRGAALGGWNIDGLCYDALTDTVYYLEDGQIMAMTGWGEPRLAAYAPAASGYYNAQGMLAGDRYINFDYSGVFVRSVNPTHLPSAVLCVYNSWYDEGQQLFAQRYPQVPIKNLDIWWNPSELKVALQSGNPAVDVARLDSLSDLDALIDAGLAASLSGIEGVKAFVAACIPQVQEAVMREGEIYALPVALDSWLLAYDPQVLEAMGLTQADLPRTYEEMCLFLTRWNREWADSGYLPMEPWGIRSALFYAMLEAYVDRLARAGEPLTFDTPLFLRLMEGLEAMDLSAVELTDWEEDPEALADRPCLFTSYYLSSALTTPEITLWPLGLTAEEPAPLGMELSALIINPGSACPQEAEGLLACAVEALAPETRLLLAPASAQPVVNPAYERQVAGWEGELARLEAQQAEGALDVTALMADYRARLENREAYRYTLSPQRIAEYRETLLPQITLRRESLLRTSADDASGFSALEEKFLSGQLSPSQFAKEMERKVRMARMMQ